MRASGKGIKILWPYIKRAQYFDLLPSISLNPNRSERHTWTWSLIQVWKQYELSFFSSFSKAWQWGWMLPSTLPSTFPLHPKNKIKRTLSSLTCSMRSLPIYQPSFLPFLPQAAKPSCVLSFSLISPHLIFHLFILSPGKRKEKVLKRQDGNVGR